MNQKSETRSQKIIAILAKRITDTIYDSRDPFTFIIKGYLLVDAFAEDLGSSLYSCYLLRMAVD
jgi:hypothetical protein